MGLRQVIVAFAAVLLGAGPAAADDSALNKEGFWTVANGRLGLAVGVEDAKGAPLPRGRTGQVETDGYAFSFAPEYDDTGRYMNSADLLDDVAIGILRQARRFRVVVGRKTLADVAVEGSGFAEVLDAVAACSRGETGWWGKGAKRP